MFEASSILNRLPTVITNYYGRTTRVLAILKIY